MALFQPFKQSRREEVPGLLQAEIEDAKGRAAAKQSENAIRSQNLIGGGMLYNAGMKAAGKSPISDYISGLFDGGYDPSAVQGVESTTGATEMGTTGAEAPVVDSTGVVTPYGAETGMVADPLTSSVEANAGLADGGVTSGEFIPTQAELAANEAYMTDTLAADAAAAEAAAAETVAADAALTDAAGTAAADAAAAQTAGTAAQTAGTAGTAATAGETAAALEGAMAANAAAGTAGTAGAAGAAGGGAMSGALAALGPLGAIAALAALFG